MAMKANFIKRSVCVGLILILSGITSCRSTTRVTEQDQRLSIREIPPGMSLEEVETLSSLKQIDPYLLYTMHFKEEYDIRAVSGDWQFVGSSRIPAWGCSLFAVYGDPENILFGRNFDWDFSPALILFTYPPDGYASVSIVDIAYLGYGEDFAFGLTDLPMD